MSKLDEYLLNNEVAAIKITHSSVRDIMPQIQFNASLVDFIETENSVRVVVLATAGGKTSKEALERLEYKVGNL